MKPRIRVRNKPLFGSCLPDYTLWTLYINGCDGEIIFMRVYDDLSTSRLYIEHVVNELLKELKLALNE